MPGAVSLSQVRCGPAAWVNAAADDIVLNDCFSGNADLCRYQAIDADNNAVGDMYLIVYFCAFPDDCIA